MYRLSVRLRGAHVGGSPCAVRILSGRPEPAACAMSGAGVREATCGKEAVIVVSYRDRFGNLVDADPRTRMWLELRRPGVAASNPKAMSSHPSGAKATRGSVLPSPAAPGIGTGPVCRSRRSGRRAARTPPAAQTASCRRCTRPCAPSPPPSGTSRSRGSRASAARRPCSTGTQSTRGRSQGRGRSARPPAGCPSGRRRRAARRSCPGRRSGAARGSGRTPSSPPACPTRSTGRAASSARQGCRTLTCRSRRSRTGSRRPGASRRSGPRRTPRPRTPRSRAPAARSRRARESPACRARA